MIVCDETFRFKKIFFEVCSGPSVQFRMQISIMNNTCLLCLSLLVKIRGAVKEGRYRIWFPQQTCSVNAMVSELCRWG